MKKIFNFGEKIKGYNTRVLNEREVRASAGILFFFAGISFMNAWLLGDFYLTKIFVIAFLIDFIIRIFINPKFSPTLLIGRFFVQNQEPEYVGAPQKKFAWIIGLLLAITMFFLVVVNNIIGPTNLFICLACLTFLFFESAFGICLGCQIYNIFNKERSKLCPGGTCKTREKSSIQIINFEQALIIILFLAIIIFIAIKVVSPENTIKSSITTSQITNNCVIPDWVVKIGHTEKYKLHHNCK